MKKNINLKNLKKIVYIELIVVFILSLVVYGQLSSPVDMTPVEEENDSDVKMENIAVLETTEGTVKIKLYLEKMPITAGNFKKLVEEGFYDGTRFHRVIEGFMIQGGDPLSKNTSNMNRWGTGGSKNIKDEFVAGLSNVKGTISMANSGQPNSGSSQFFINLVDNTGLDFDKPPLSSKHPVFGEVIEGMDVIDKIGAVETTGRPYDRPVEGVMIVKATMESE